MFTETELNEMKNNEVVGYDNGNCEMFEVKARVDSDGFVEFYCEEYDCCYDNSELSDDWFVKA